MKCAVAGLNAISSSTTVAVAGLSGTIIHIFLLNWQKVSRMVRTLFGHVMDVNMVKNADDNYNLLKKNVWFVYFE